MNPLFAMLPLRVPPEHDVVRLARPQPAFVNVQQGRVDTSMQSFKLVLIKQYVLSSHFCDRLTMLGFHMVR
jgi:hypothetical protein